jgi:hypothetical protein
MGKAARLKRVRGPKRSRDELLELLAENRHFLERSADAFDSGYEAEAKRLAVVLRVLLHDTQASHSLLGQLGVKDRLNFLDSADPINPKNLLPTPGLVIMRATTTVTGAEGQYVAPLDMDRPNGTRCVGFAGWWQNAVMKVDGVWSRKDLVLTLANTEGGAHVDPDLDDRYNMLAKHNGIGFMAMSASGRTPFAGDAVAVAVRQVTYEVLETLTREKQFFK